MHSTRNKTRTDHHPLDPYPPFSGSGDLSEFLRQSQIDNSGNIYDDIICNLWSSFDSCLNNLSAKMGPKWTKSGIQVTASIRIWSTTPLFWQR